MVQTFTRLSALFPRVAAIALLATAFAAPQALAQARPAPVKLLEDAIETSTDAVILPSSQPGRLSFRNCGEPCNMRALELTSESKIFVGGTEVSIADFNAYVRRTGPQFLMVFVQPNRTAITRLMVYGRMQ